MPNMSLFAMPPPMSAIRKVLFRPGDSANQLQASDAAEGVYSKFQFETEIESSHKSLVKGLTVLMDKSNPIVLSFHDSLLHQSDVDLLDNCQWLNDQIIEFYFEYQARVVCKDNQSDVIFIGPGVAQLIKLVPVEEVLAVLPILNADFKYAFFPVNDSMKTDRSGGTHWTLLLYRKEDRYFLHYESMPVLTNYFHARTIADKVNSALNPSTDLNFKQEFCCKQKNSYDCGVHVICNVDYLVRKLVFGAIEDWFDTRDVERRRKELKELILSLKT